MHLLKYNFSRFKAQCSNVSKENRFGLRTFKTLPFLVVSKTAKCTIGIDFSNFVSFKVFSDALHQTCPINLTKSSVIPSFARVYLLWLFTFFVCSSSAVKFLTSVSHRYNIPLYLHILLQKFAMETYFNTKDLSTLIGNCDNSIVNKYRFLCENMFLDHNRFQSLIAGTQFSHLLSNTDLDRFNNEVYLLTSNFVTRTETLDENSNPIFTYSIVATDNVIFDSVFSFFNQLPSIFRSENHSLSFKLAEFKYSVSSVLNYYRFRNIKDCNSSYSCNSISLSALTESTITEMAAILKVFKPTFLHNGKFKPTVDFDPTEVCFDISPVSEFSALELLFSSVCIKDDNKKPSGQKPSKGKRNGDKPGKPEPSSTGANGGHQSTDPIGGGNGGSIRDKAVQHFVSSLSNSKMKILFEVFTRVSGVRLPFEEFCQRVLNYNNINYLDTGYDVVLYTYKSDSVSDQLFKDNGRAFHLN